MRVPCAESSTARRFSLKGDAALQNNALLNFLGHGPEAGSWGLCAGCPVPKVQLSETTRRCTFWDGQAGHRWAGARALWAESEGLTLASNAPQGFGRSARGGVWGASGRLVRQFREFWVWRFKRV